MAVFGFFFVNGNPIQNDANSMGDLHRTYGGNGSLHSTFYLIPAMAENLQAQGKVYERDESEVTRLGDSNTSCHRRQHSTGSGYINVDATCPWHIEMVSDDTLVPQVIARAKCNCNSRRNGICKEVYYYMPVLKKICVNGRYTYHAGFERIPVGCTFVYNRHTTGRTSPL